MAPVTYKSKAADSFDEMSEGEMMAPVTYKNDV
jgi:hypothetical protein